MKDSIQNYELMLIERDGAKEVITGRDIGLRYNQKNSISKIYIKQNSFFWISSLFRKQRYYVTDLFEYNNDYLNNRIMILKCLNKDIVEPENAGFVYSNGEYKIIDEIWGNKVRNDRLMDAIRFCILQGRTELNLDEMLCYENPVYTADSYKTLKTREHLNYYVSTNIMYKFGEKYEVLDGDIIHKWLRVDDNLDIVISKDAVVTYVKELSSKYDTVGISRSFKTSTGKVVEVRGGLYGWKINQEEEVNAILEFIKNGEMTVREPVYIQKAVSRGSNEFGNTYIEINITRQQLWFYKNGKLIIQGSVVTGNPNKGNSTVLGTYFVNYKQKSATLKGPGYEVGVTYWMPFYGNMGIHDAKWRSAFGGEIYKSRGTHGCVNAPYYLAKTIFESVEEGVPVIIYKEE